VFARLGLSDPRAPQKNVPNNASNRQFTVLPYVGDTMPPKGDTPMFKKVMRRVERLCDETHDHYDCDGCVWEGVDVPKGDVEAANEAFERHNCRQYVNGL
jgi:hypothetical protein